MPQNKHALIRYHVIDNLLRQSNLVKTSLIVEHCQRKTGYRVSPRTIQLDINAMKFDSFLGYYAPIEYCKKNKAYYYSNADYTLTPFQFSESEVIFLESVSIMLKSEITAEEYLMLSQIILKIKASSLGHL